jgi:hypothetical protein
MELHAVKSSIGQREYDKLAKNRVVEEGVKLGFERKTKRVQNVNHDDCMENNTDLGLKYGAAKLD